MLDGGVGNFDSSDDVKMFEIIRNDIDGALGSDHDDPVIFFEFIEGSVFNEG